MAEIIFHMDDVSLTSTWSLKYNIGGGSGLYPTLQSSSGASQNRTVSISGIPDGENVKRAILSATLNLVGDYDYSETITVNGLNFWTGTRKIDASEFTNGSDWNASFYFYGSCDTSKPAPAGTLHGTVVNKSSTLYLSDIKLTLTTGVGAAFDGEIGSLPEGTKILVDEPEGVQGTYSIVHHGYGSDTLCLLWRDSCLPTTVAFNQNADTFLVDNYGQMDGYLNATFYNVLPDSTKAYIQPAIYPTMNERANGVVTNIERYVCTPSVRELKETIGYEEWHGYPLDYLDTVICNENYWTRSISSTTGFSYRISASGNAADYDRSYASGVRPCFCVLEEQKVVPSDDGTYYVLASAVDAPANVYLNSMAADLSDQQRDTAATLSWDAVPSPLVTGYEAWSCGTVDGKYAFVGAVSAGDDGTIPTELTVRTGGKGFELMYYKVKAITTTDTDYLDSGLSAETRLMATKRTNVHYYDGTRWLLATPKYYNGSVWKASEGTKYYDGTQWLGNE